MVGIKDRKTNQVQAKVVKNTDAATLQKFVTERTHEDTQVYTDDCGSFIGLDRPHKAVKHSAGQYASGSAHTNGIESLWAVFKRGYKGTYLQMSPKHLQRYVDELVRRHNPRRLDTIEQMERTAKGFVGKRLTCGMLTRGTEPSSIAGEQLELF